MTKIDIISGFLGAGKTTLMSCILGDKKASSGQVFIKGKTGKAQDQIAVLLQENTIPSQLKVKELIAFFQDISENGLSKVENGATVTNPMTLKAHWNAAEVNYTINYWQQKVTD